jgi:hypothetical protein
MRGISDAPGVLWRVLLVTFVPGFVPARPIFVRVWSPVMQASTTLLYTSVRVGGVVLDTPSRHTPNEMIAILMQRYLSRIQSRRRLGKL